MLEHKKFIESDIADILKESIRVADLNYKGIESHPLFEYILQTTFLKMTGYSEQKLKCILWDVSTIDYDFRYETYNGRWDYGECSGRKDKEKIFKKLEEKVKAFDSQYMFFNSKTNVDYRKDAVELVEKELKKSCLKYASERSLDCLDSIYKERFDEKVEDTKTLFVKMQKKNNSNEKARDAIYDILYKHRNRCAHNLKSYQIESPKLYYMLTKVMDKLNDSYFAFFAELIALDNIFKKLYKKVIECLYQNRW